MALGMGNGNGRDARDSYCRITITGATPMPTAVSLVRNTTLAHLLRKADFRSSRISWNFLIGRVPTWEPAWGPFKCGRLWPLTGTRITPPPTRRAKRFVGIGSLHYVPSLDFTRAAGSGASGESNSPTRRPLICLHTHLHSRPTTRQLPTPCPWVSPGYNRGHGAREEDIPEELKAYKKSSKDKEGLLPVAEGFWVSIAKGFWKSVALALELLPVSFPLPGLERKSNKLLPVAFPVLL